MHDILGLAAGLTVDRHRQADEGKRPGSFVETPELEKAGTLHVLTYHNCVVIQQEVHLYSESFQCSQNDMGPQGMCIAFMTDWFHRM